MKRPRAWKSVILRAWSTSSPKRSDLHGSWKSRCSLISSIESVSVALHCSKSTSNPNDHPKSNASRLRARTAFSMRLNRSCLGIYTGGECSCVPSPIDDATSTIRVQVLPSSCCWDGQHQGRRSKSLHIPLVIVLSDVKDASSLESSAYTSGCFIDSSRCYVTLWTSRSMIYKVSFARESYSTKELWQQLPVEHLYRPQQGGIQNRMTIHLSPAHLKHVADTGR
jgi:hypothetical protein